MACNFCLSDNHTPDQCPDNPTKAYLPWQQPMPMLGAPVLPAQKFRICHLFNARDGPCCTYRQCKFSHPCSLCRGHTFAPLARGGPMRAPKGQDKVEQVTSVNGRSSSRHTEPTRLLDISGATSQCVYPYELSLLYCYWP